jgi:hypothetical protein
MLCVDCNETIQHKGVCDTCLKVRIVNIPKVKEHEPISRGPKRRAYEYEFDGDTLYKSKPTNYKSWRERSKESAERLKKYEVQPSHDPVVYDDPLLHKVYKVMD